MAEPARRAGLFAPALMVASGFAGLGYQIVWTQQGALWLGHDAAAVLAVVTAFFGGLALGALVLGRCVERSARPARWYAGCEALIGAWSLLLAFALQPAAAFMSSLIGAEAGAWRQWAVGFGGSFVLLLPATAAMGATLPALERALARRNHAALAGLYAANTAGAVLGVLASAFVLVPGIGLLRTAAFCAGLNLLCALVAWRSFDTAASPGAGPAPDRPSRHGPLLGLLAATGALGIGYEVLVVRVVSQQAENTVYTFALLLAVYLSATAAGAAAHQRLAGRALPDARAGENLLLALLAAACLAGASTLWAGSSVKEAMATLLGGGYGAALAGEAAMALAAFALPACVMGALFSQLAIRARDEGLGLGLALAANTLGAAAAPLIFGVLLLPAAGAKAALLAVVAGYLVLCVAWTRPVWLLPAVGGAALAALAPPLVFVEMPEGGHLLRYVEGATAAVSVVEDAEGVRRLRIDNRQQEGSSASVLADARQALLPLLLHPAPRRALFLGLGTGITASAAADDPGLEVDAVELLGGVIEASADFADAAGRPRSPRLHLHAADARRFARESKQRYDLVVADNFHPARAGSGSLYTVEHFRALRWRLAEGGLICQWLPLHQLDLPTLRSIVRSFVEVFPDARAMLATNSLATPVLGLVSRSAAGPFEPAAVRARIASAGWPRPPAAFGLGDEWAVLGSFVADATSLRRFAGDALMNTDDQPVVAYRAPRAAYAPEMAPAGRLVALLGELELSPAAVVGADAVPRLAAYVRARRAFIAAGLAVRPTNDPREMLAQVRAPLLAVLRTSADFAPARDPLLRLAQALAPIDPGAAATLRAEIGEPPAGWR